MSSSREDTEVSASVEDKVNSTRSYRSAISNPRNSDEAKEHSRDVLDNELHGSKYQQELYDARGRNKEPNRVAGGLKAAQTNRRVTERGKEEASRKLDQMSEESE